MRLLICTQAVDRSDPVLGFFHQWLQEFARHFEQIHVVCLKEGEHDLPSNVFVHSLGKPAFAKASAGKEGRGMSRIKYVWNFYRYTWSLRNEYDAVFVHMNQEYVLLGGKLWWIFRKRVVLWRNHKKGSILTRLADLLSHVVCHTSPEAYVAGFKNAVRMPIGIDTNLFTPRGDQVDKSSILFLGRLDAVKHPDIFLEALGVLAREGTKFRADMYGDPTPGRESYAEELRKRFSATRGVTFHPGVRNDQTPAIYSGHAIYVNLTPSGSFDKTIGEAMSSGCVVVAANEVLRGVLPDELIVDPQKPESVVARIRTALVMDEAARAKPSERSRAYIEREHSLSLLASKLAALYKS